MLDKFTVSLRINEAVLKKKITSYILVQDMLHLIRAWRHVKGYPVNGQKTHTNSHTASTNKLLLSYRMSQLQKILNIKKNTRFSMIVKAEYNNRLWYHNWYYEWFEACVNLGQHINSRTLTIKLDLFNLAKGHTGGYRRKGAASKMGKSKKTLKAATLGLPVHFPKYMYMKKLPAHFPYKIHIADGKNVYKNNTYTYVKFNNIYFNVLPIKYYYT